MSAARTGGARAGRPVGSDGSNREVILSAARREFAANGYRGATLRSIAAAAGFDVALLSHYFGNKDGLFAATLELPAGAPQVLATALAGPAAERGVRLTRGYLSLWEDPSTGGQMRVLARSALSNEVAGERFRGLLSGVVAAPDIDLLPGGREGFVLAMSHLLGVAITRYLVRVPPLADLDVGDVVARVAPAVQGHLDGLPEPGATGAQPA
ncbi:TetR family transcriptional regulator [Paraoerskovia sediminicola]|uniref:TetR family transcriptional regulator n=1 Tax=Paraoerskovia sediminicola TaxID=1138587 RepID=A0ABN6XCM9_9CELL|nr:TetR family transcriptional regulator [Paraoerskovia sediminicola]BDZ41868.1 TetR family transcriptional regulator [Paraoerskovia sediminicola]